MKTLGKLEDMALCGDNEGCKENVILRWDKSVAGDHQPCYNVLCDKIFLEINCSSANLKEVREGGIHYSLVNFA